MCQIKNAIFIIFVLHLLPVVSWPQLKPVFDRLPSSVSGITFQNKLVETREQNIITYEYFYNGGGVATGDFNNDGLIDLYFTANTESNRLYLNKGNLKFEDITKRSGTAGRKGWKTGVSLADVNGDGWLDIYVCYSGNEEPARRKNQLLINKGDLTFEDKAEEMGVADAGYSTHAAFFDYDRDGDLDLFVVNHNIKDLRNFDAAFVKKMVDPDAGDRLYRNEMRYTGNEIDQGSIRFTDVTRQAGIISNPLGYGLSVMVSDVNNDGWPDLYVSNDYVEEDYLYINNRNGTFSDRLKEQLGHISNFSMGADIADINNDGLSDILTLDMLPADNKRQKLLYAPDNYELYNNMLRNGFYHQLMRNMLQINNGNESFSEVGQLSGVSNTDWSWAALFADFDLDGYKDLFVTNGYGRDMINRDFMKFYADSRLKFLKGQQDEKMFRMLQGIKSTPLRSFMFKNLDGLKFRDCSVDWGFDEINFSQGAAYADLDNDGDLDLVVNRMNDEAAVFRNNTIGSSWEAHFLKLTLIMKGGNRNALGAKAWIYTPNGLHLLENYPGHGFQSSMQGPLHTGLVGERIDSIIVQWPDGTKEKPEGPFSINRHDTIRYAGLSRLAEEKKEMKTIFKSAGIALPYHHAVNPTNDFKIQPMMPNMISYSGPRIAMADVNKDGLIDIYVCGARDRPGQLFLRRKDGNFSLQNEKALEEDAPYEDADALFFDADGDGDADLYVVSGGFILEENLLQDRLYINENGRFIRKPAALPKESLSGSCIASADFDGDGDLDLFIGSRVIPGRYPEAPQSMLLVNDGKGRFEDHTASRAPSLKNAGMITDALWQDVNGDGKPELILCGEWMAITCLENLDGKLNESTEKYFPTGYYGWWNRLAASDLDKDGDIDLVAGNWGVNSQIQVSKEEPATLYFGDFDENGSLDPVICYYIQGKSYPMASRDEITDQIVGLRQRFPTYDSYSEATIQDILSPEQLKSAGRLQADFFETAWFENVDGKFILRHLPVQASYSPVYAIETSDFDGDGNKDILLAGNMDQARIKIGKLDANYGVLLAGDGKGNFRYVPQLQSGLNVKGCVRSMATLQEGDKEKYLLFFITNQLPSVYRF